MSLTRLFARSRQGERAYGDRPNRRGKNISIIGAISLDKVLVHHEILGAVDSITFEAFLARKLVPNLKKGDWVIMDNCSIHKGKEIKKIIKKAGANLLYLPTYYPDFNPIENCWSKIKSILRQISARTYPDLLEAIELAFNEVSVEDIKNWFTHCCYYTSPE